MRFDLVSLVRTGAVWVAASAAIGMAITPARTQQYFNGPQATPNGAINGGSGVWDNATTNWTNATGTVSSTYDATAATTAVLGASGASTPATGGIVNVTAGGIQLTGTVQFAGTGDHSIYSIQGGNLTVAAGGSEFDVGSVAAGAGPSAVIASSIVGHDGISVFGPGTLVLSGVNTYAGGTFLCTCASLQIGDATHTASIVGAVTNEGLFDIANANTASITSIHNDGGLTTFHNATNAASIAITNRNSGETDFIDNSSAANAVIVNRFSALTTFNDFSSAANANITNRYGGQTNFFDNSAAANASIVNRYGGLTVFFDFSTAGNANITNRFGGTSIFSGNSTAGNATITTSGFGAGFGPPVGLAFFDASTAGTATISNSQGLIAFGAPGGFDTASADHASITNNAGGMLQFSAFTTAGNATITTSSGGAVAFFDNATGGRAQFIANGTGFVDFSGSFGPKGDGRISAGSIAGSGTYIIGAGNTLTVGSNNLSTEVSGVIANGCGCLPANLEKVGSGTLTLSGTNTYTGATTVFGGVLDVEGSIALSSLTTVNVGGALTGTGVVGNTTIASAGIFLPGNGTPGTVVTVNGNLAFQSGALYFVQLNSTISTFANVTGSAALAGNVGASFAPGSTVMKQYPILTAALGHSGGFDGAAVLDGPPTLIATLSYDPTHAFINFALDFSVIPGLNVNQKNVGNALTNFFNANSGIPLTFASLSPAGLSQVSGETAVGTQQATFNAMNLFLGLLSDPFVDGRGSGANGSTGAAPFAEQGDSAGAYAARSKSERDAYAMFNKTPLASTYDPRWSVWASGFGGSQTTDGNTALGSNDATSRVFGTAVGVDYRISPFTLAGFALAGGGASFASNGFGSGRSDLFQAGAFARHTIGAAYVSAAAAYGWQDITTDRIVTVTGIDRLHAQFNANAYSGRVEGGYRFVTPWLGIAPYAAEQFTTYSLPAYAETVLSGVNSFALNYAAKDVTASRTELGVRADRPFAMPDGILILRGRLAWAHDFNTDRTISPAFQTLPGAAFVVNGAAMAPDSALTTASAEMKWMNGWSAAATFEGENSRVTQSYAGKGVLRYTW